MAEEAGLNRDIASSLLYLPSKTTLTEEKQRPWSINHFQPFQKPFLKTWDRCSGSQPDDEHRMLSRAPRQRLDTLESRKSSLTTHIDHSKWNPTPYISFTTSPAALKKMANWRASQRGPQTLTVLDPNARMADGLPILDVLAEMDHYGIKNPYKKLNQYYKDHYLCLWEVTGREIIGHWEWADLVANEQWYHEIILPAFREHTKSRSLEEETPGLSAAMNKLSCMFLLSGILYTA